MDMKDVTEEVTEKLMAGRHTSWFAYCPTVATCCVKLAARLGSASTQEEREQVLSSDVVTAWSLSVTYKAELQNNSATLCWMSEPYMLSCV
jgi:hypothetical protein